MDLSIHLDARPGALAAMGEALGRAGVSVEGGGVFTHGGIGVAHYLFADGEAARVAPERGGIAVDAVNDVILMRLRQSKPGQLGSVARCMADAGVDMRDTTASARLAALIGDRARARMLDALMGGLALTATELAIAADVATSTASSHLSQLTRGGVLTLERQGRHRYYRIADVDVAELVETISSVAERARPAAIRIAPADERLRRARVCYDHLAGEEGVWLLVRLRERRLLEGNGSFVVTPRGSKAFAAFGIDVRRLERARRPLCRTCLDWSERRHHLAGALGAALLDRVLGLRWARRAPDGRALLFSDAGSRSFRQQF